MEPFDPIQGLSTLESLRGSESLRILPSVLPVTSLQETSCGFHRFEPVRWNGVATAPGNVTYPTDRKSTRLNSSHSQISYAVFCLKKKKTAVRNDSTL